MEGKVQANISCDPSEREAWTRAARREGKSFAEWVRELLNMASGHKPKSK